MNNIYRREFIAGAVLVTSDALARPLGPKGIATLSQGVPARYSRALIDGVPVSYNGHPVFTKPDGSSIIYL